MWGTRLVRSCGRQEFSWTALQVAIRNLSLEARLGSNDVLREVSESVGGSRANGKLMDAFELILSTCKCHWQRASSRLALGGPSLSPRHDLLYRISVHSHTK